VGHRNTVGKSDEGGITVPTPANVSGSKPARIASGDSARLARIVSTLRL